MSSAAPTSPASDASTFAVIGAGPAGCAAADALARGGKRVVLFEAAERIGGRTACWRDDGIVIDSGAGFFTNFYPTLQEMLPRLGLADRVSPLARQNVLVCDGRAIDFELGSLRSFALNRFVGVAGKLRMTAQTALAVLRYRHVDHADPATLAPYDDRSIRDHALRTLGQEAYDFLVRPGVEPFWYFSCAEVSRSLLLALQSRAPSARFYSLRDGMDTICTRLAAQPGIEVRTSHPVQRIERDDATVRVDDESFAGAVVATTASAACSAVADDLLAPEMRTFLASQRYVPNVHATFRLPRAACPPESARFPCGPGTFPVAALSFNSQKRQGSMPDGDEILGVYLSAAASAELLLLDGDDAAVQARSWELARRLCPSLPEHATPFRSIARREAIPVHEVGRYRRAAEALRAQRGPVTLAGDMLATATVDGALRSGREAARTLLGGGA